LSFYSNSAFLFFTRGQMKRTVLKIDKSIAIG